MGKGEIHMQELLQQSIRSGASRRCARFRSSDVETSVRARRGFRTGARKASGFTMVELIIVMAIIAVLTLLAVPSFQALTVSNRLTTTANELVGAINLARTEAIKRNSNTQFCGSSGNGTGVGASCANPGEVWVLKNGAASQAAVATSGITTPIVLTGTMKAIRFGGQGLGYDPAAGTAPLTGLIADISTASLSTDNHRCINLTAGSIIVTKKSSAACT
jgi:type IV fimbrial biogenesis protein FimT